MTKKSHKMFYGVNKKFIKTLFLGAMFTPIILFAESATTTSTTPIDTSTPAQIFVLCTQSVIETRDNAISVARNAYNISTSEALTARKEAEKNAVSLTDITAKKTALRTALNTFKTSNKIAQETLTKARKDAWTIFEINIKNCREAKRDTNETKIIEKKEGVEKRKEERKENLETKQIEIKQIKEDRKEEIKKIQGENKEEIKQKQVEIKTLRENLYDRMKALRSLFRLDRSEVKK